MTLATTKSIWPLPLTITLPPMTCTRKRNVSVMKIRPWGSTLLKTRMDTGWKLCRHAGNTWPAEKDERPTSNAQHRMMNGKDKDTRPLARPFCFHSTLDVRCSVFNVHLSPGRIRNRLSPDPCKDIDDILSDHIETGDQQ